MKKAIVFSLSFCIIIFLYLTPALALSWFGGEKEIKDEYLEKLFAPDFPYESVKVVEDSDGNRFIVVKAKEKVKDQMGIYANLLLSRGVNIHGDYYYGYFSWQTRATEFAITITRKVEGEPDTIEISESRVKDPETGKPIVAITARWKKITIAVEKDFGKKWRKIQILPESDVVGGRKLKFSRYPGAKKAVFKEFLYRPIYDTDRHEDYLYIRTAYVAKASLKEVSLYYYTELQKKYKKAHGSLYWERDIENPSRGRYPITVFGIKTVGTYVALGGYDPYDPNIKSMDIRLDQSNDPNLFGYIQIMFDE